MLLPKIVRGTSKKNKGSKKGVKSSPSKSIPKQVEKVAIVSPKKFEKEITKPVVEDTSTHAKEIVPTKSGVLRRLKKMAHIPHHSPERPSGKDATSTITHKPKINRK